MSDMRTLLTAIAGTFVRRVERYVVERGWHVEVGIATTDVLPVVTPAD